MPLLYKIITATAVLMLPLLAHAQSSFSRISSQAHPRLFMDKQESKKVLKNVEKDPDLLDISKQVQKIGDSLAAQPALTYQKKGFRLLGVSRNAIHRILNGAYLYRASGDRRYLDTAKRELLTVSNFPDWNPVHFLDVAEMTFAAAIGYDWLYSELSEDERSLVKNAILQKGILPSLDKRYNGWLKMKNNWAQVCNAGMAMGAMAIYEDNPQLADEIISRSLQSMKIPMERYAPDGAYPEGYAYWNYGTTYNIIFIDLLQQLMHDDYGLQKIPGFMKTGEYFLQAAGPSGIPFNYSDSGTRKEVAPASFWFASQLKDKELYWNTLQIFRQKERKIYANERFLPMALVWGARLKAPLAKTPTKLFFKSEGENPVVMMRTGWDPDKSLFLGFKLGSPNLEHAHMDVGSFVFDALGERWAEDLGMQDYYTLEQHHFDLWNYSQNSDRWKIFRYNNFSHNLPTFDEQLQHANGNATILKTGNSKNLMFAISDLTPVYQDQVASEKRGVALYPAFGMIQDEIKTLGKPTKMRWNMVTSASVTIVSKSAVRLQKNGKEMTLVFDSQTPFKIVEETTAPRRDFDMENKGSRMIGIEAQLPANGEFSFRAFLIPGDYTQVPLKFIPLLNW